MYGFLELLKEKRLSEFNYELLNEGLIKSVDYDFAIDKINNLLNKYEVEGKCSLYEGKDRLILLIEDLNIYHKKIFYPNFISLLNNLGYYMSNYKIGHGNIENSKIDLIEFINNNNTIIIHLNKKFDTEIGHISEFLYHVTEKQNIGRIKKRGLIDKSKNFIENHPERIYFFVNVDDCYDYIEFKNLGINYHILKIDIKTLNNIKLYEDPKYVPYVKAYYTYDNIPPYSIEIIK